MSKPLREHHVADVKKAKSSGAEGLKEAVAIEVQDTPRKISRIKKLEKFDGDWEYLYRKLPPLVKTLTKAKTWFHQ